MTRPIRILGIDPGLRRTGWGMVEVAGNRLGFLGCGSVTTRDEDALATSVHHMGRVPPHRARVKFRPVTGAC